MLLASKRLSRKVEVAPANSLNPFCIVFHKSTTIIDRPINFPTIKHVAYLLKRIFQLFKYDNTTPINLPHTVKY